MTSRRRGFALVVALAAVALTSALVLSTALRSAEDARAGRRAALQLLARDAAEQGVWAMLVGADPRAVRDAPVGSVAATARSDIGGRTDVRMVRVDSVHVWIVATARYARGDERAGDRLALSAVLSEETGALRLAPLSGPAWVPLY